MIELIGIFDSILGVSKRFTGGEFYYYCPFCHHHKPKLAVNLNKRKWQCWKCGAKGETLLSLLRRLDISSEQIKKIAVLLEEELPYVKHEKTTAILTLPEEFIPLYSASQSIEFKHAMAYLHNRGITNQQILEHQLGYCASGRYAGRIIIPSFDDMNNLNFFTGRDFYNNSLLSYVTPSVTKNIVGFDSTINWNYPVVLVEGVFDALAIRRNAVPLFGKRLSNKIQQKIRQGKSKTVYLALDNDALKDTLYIAETLMKNDITVYLVSVSEKDPSILGYEKIHQLIKNAEQLTFSKLLHMKISLVNI